MLLIRVLGGFEVWFEETRVPDNRWSLRRAKRLIKMLALAPEHCLSEEAILDILWPEVADSSVTHRLHQTLYVARKALGKGCDSFFRLKDGAVLLGPHGEVSTDLEEFEQAGARALTSEDAIRYREARRLYAGELLPADRCEDWSRDHRERARELHQALLLGEARLLEQQGSHAEAAGLLQQVIAVDGFCEEAHQSLMRCYAANGQRTQALRQYKSFHSLIAAELGVEPDPATRSLRDQIAAANDCAQEVRVLPARIAAPGSSEDGPKLAMAASYRSNVARPTTGFVGRQRLNALIEAFQDTRFLTVTGPAGIGKTRLTLEAAAAMLPEFPDGVWHLDVGLLPGPESLPGALLGLVGAPAVSPQESAIAMGLYLKGKVLLIVLDGCQKLEKACLDLVERVINSSANVKVLASSTQPIGMPDERLFSLSGLSVPQRDTSIPPDQLEHYGAGLLFLDRIRALPSYFPVAAEQTAPLLHMFQLVEGHPLAIELIAGQTQHRRIQDLARLLQDSIDTLGSAGLNEPSSAVTACIQLSYGFLPREEQELLRTLALFDGPLTRHQIQVVWDDVTGSPNDGTHAIVRLLTAHLMIELRNAGGHPMYVLPSLVRDYARTYLVRQGKRPGQRLPAA